MSWRGIFRKAGINIENNTFTFDKNKDMIVRLRSSLTTGSIRGIYNILTLEKASVDSQVEGIKSQVVVEDVTHGEWINAITGAINFSTSGASHGMAASICAEMIPPNSSLVYGSLYALDCNFGCGANASWGSAGPVAFIKFENWGIKAHFSANAFLFHLIGETGAGGALLSANERTLKVLIGETTKYLYLSNTEDDLGAMVVDSVTLSPATGIIGIDIDSIIVAGSFTGISIAPTLTGQQTKATGISVDFDWSGGDINAYGIDVDIQQTGETSGGPAVGSRGNIQAIRGDARAAFTIDDAYAVRGSCYVLMTSAEQANDCVGVFATIQHTGVITRGATESAFCAMKADVANTCSGSWTGQMFNLMLGFGSSVNYGALSAIIYGYTHADARADYGMYINNYSPYMLAGIRLGETTGASPIMESALWISTAGWGDGYNTGAILIADDQGGTPVGFGSSAAGLCIERVNVTAAALSGSYFFGKYVSLATSATMVDGFIMGHYVKVTLDHVAYENYAVRGRMVVAVAQTGNTGNQYIGLFGAVELASGAHALRPEGGCYGVLGTTNLAGGSLDQPLIAGYFDSDPLVDVAGGSYAIKARMQHKTDYGLEIHCQTSDAIAGIHIKPTLAAALPVGILFTGEDVGGQGSITKALKFAAATNCGIAVNTTTLTLTPTSHHLIVDIAGIDHYIPIFDKANWAD